MNTKNGGIAQSIAITRKQPPGCCGKGRGYRGGTVYPKGNGRDVRHARRQHADILANTAASRFTFPLSSAGDTTGLPYDTFCFHVAMPGYIPLSALRLVLYIVSEFPIDRKSYRKSNQKQKMSRYPILSAIESVTKVSRYLIETPFF